MMASTDKAGTAIKPVRAATIGPSGKVDEPWRNLLLGNVVSIKSVHPNNLVKFKSCQDGRVFKSDGARPEGNEEDEDSEEETWLCNGSAHFKTGCKSGQTEFGMHEGTEGWQDPDRENCDMDLCEMCIRWILHCEKNKLDSGWQELTPDGEPINPSPTEEEQYLTERDQV